MSIFSQFGDGWKLFKNALLFIIKRPIFLFPILLGWVTISSVVLYLRYWHEPISIGNAWVMLPYLLLITYGICIANILMLELLQQAEKDQKFSLVKALRETIFNDAIKAIPIAIVWAVLWLFLLILRVLTSRKNSSSKAEPSMEDAAKTLGGVNSGPIGWSSLGISMLEKLLRLVSFLALPGIAWENKGPFQALGESINIIRKNPIQFLSVYTLTGVAATIMSLPLIPIFVGVKEGIEYSHLTWTLVLLYEGIIWSLSIYLEQMMLALLYQWHMKWVAAGEIGSLSSVPRPQILYDILGETIFSPSSIVASNPAPSPAVAPMPIIEKLLPQKRPGKYTLILVVAIAITLMWFVSQDY